MSEFAVEINRRRTFAIISHPDAGKTTLTEKLLLFGGAISLAGTVKGRKASRHATSDWMALEKERGISVTTSVMQFPYQDCIVNLLDTPGHEDFSEDTYRTLTAVDSALMVIDVAKGVEARTIKLMEVCRLRDTPIVTFINKLDREGKEPLALMDEVEAVLTIECAPITWPIGMGQRFLGIYHIEQDALYCYTAGMNHTVSDIQRIDGLDSQEASAFLGDMAADFREEIELVKGVCARFDPDAFKDGRQTPVYFGSAVNNFGIRELLDGFVAKSPAPSAREAQERSVEPTESSFSGFVFKIQANMDPLHRDRIAFMRVCSGRYEKGMRVHQVRTKKQVQINKAMTFMAGDRAHAECAYPGDILGLYNHGTIQIGDTFSQGEALKFTGIPNFAPELFRLVRLDDPLKQKALLKGLIELSEEGATQVFRPIDNNDLIIGAVGVLQFDVVAHRLKDEYGVNSHYQSIDVATARWVSARDEKMLTAFKQEQRRHLALDGGGCLTYLAPSRVSLEITQEHWPDIEWVSTREI